MFDAIFDRLETKRTTRYRLFRDGEPLTYARVLDLCENDGGFRAYLTRLLADASFSAYRWETPPLSTATTDQPFQFVLLNSPGFSSRKTDSVTFDQYFTADETAAGVVSFRNLAGDARLIVPSPRGELDTYGHLAAFMRKAPERQLDAFWRVVGSTVKSEIRETPLWLSTAGGGVAWLHVRIDSCPKYYGYAPYKAAF